MNTENMTGLEFLKSMIKGEIPPPSMATVIPLKLTKVEDGYAMFKATASKNHLNPMGTVHGGFAATVMDSVTGCAVHTTLGPGDGYGTVDLNVKLLKAVPMDVELTAEARIIHCSGRLGVSYGTLKDDDGNIYAHATASCMIFRQKA